MRKLALLDMAHRWLRLAGQIDKMACTASRTYRARNQISAQSRPISGSNSEVQTNILTKQTAAACDGAVEELHTSVLPQRLKSAFKPCACGAQLRGGLTVHGRAFH